MEETKWLKPSDTGCMRSTRSGAFLLKDPSPIAHDPIVASSRIPRVAQRQSLPPQAAPRGLDEEAGNGEKAAGVVGAEMTPVTALDGVSGCSIETPCGVIIVIVGEI